MKIITTIGIVTFVYLIVSCNTDHTKIVKIQKTDSLQTLVTNSKSNDLMKQKCLICHMEKPNFEKKASMIAPPMLKIKEHYSPNFQDKEEFVAAIADFVTKPSEDKVLMPGAVRKFKIMPNLGITKEDALIIAAEIYDTDFEAMPEIENMQASKLALNNGEKWKLKKESIAEINRINAEIENFSSDNIGDYEQLGKDIFGSVKKILLDSDYKDETVNQLHYFFGASEESIHKLESSKSIEDSKKVVEKLKKHFLLFNNYFEYK